ncbi:hypothetical protein DWS26_23950 [Escherichia coli]|nr:hypothetical protein [Escherichia coli]
MISGRPHRLAPGFGCLALCHMKQQSIALHALARYQCYCLVFTFIIFNLVINILILPSRVT